MRPNPFRMPKAKPTTNAWVAGEVRKITDAARLIRLGDAERIVRQHLNAQPLVALAILDELRKAART